MALRPGNELLAKRLEWLKNSETQAVDGNGMGAETDDSVETATPLKADAGTVSPDICR